MSQDRNSERPSTEMESRNQPSENALQEVNKLRAQGQTAKSEHLKAAGTGIPSEFGNPTIVYTDSRQQRSGPTLQKELLNACTAVLEQELKQAGVSRHVADSLKQQTHLGSDAMPGDPVKAASKLSELVDNAGQTLRKELEKLAKDPSNLLKMLETVAERTLASQAPPETSSTSASRETSSAPSQESQVPVNRSRQAPADRAARHEGNNNRHSEGPKGSAHEESLKNSSHRSEATKDGTSSHDEQKASTTGDGGSYGKGSTGHSREPSGKTTTADGHSDSGDLEKASKQLADALRQRDGHKQASEQLPEAVGKELQKLGIDPNKMQEYIHELTGPLADVLKNPNDPSKLERYTQELMGDLRKAGFDPYKDLREHWSQLTPAQREERFKAIQQEEATALGVVTGAVAVAGLSAVEGASGALAGGSAGVALGGLFGEGAGAVPGAIGGAIFGGILGAGHGAYDGAQAGYWVYRQMTHRNEGQIRQLEQSGAFYRSQPLCVPKPPVINPAV